MSNFNDIYCQRNARYLNEQLGKGVGGTTIYGYGCYFMSLCRQLEEDPLLINKLFLDYGLWTNQNYIDVSELANKLPSVFKMYKYQDNFTMDQFGAWCSDENIIAVCKVNAAAIGGSGTHFVGEERRDGVNAVIFDPYYGDIIRVADRYNDYGNILSMRIFYLQDNWKVALKQLLNITGGNMNELETCLKDRQKFWDERDAMYRELEVSDQTKAIAEIKRLQKKKKSLIITNVLSVQNSP